MDRTRITMHPLVDKIKQAGVKGLIFTGGGEPTLNKYLGGAISPGLTLRYKALHNLTANLPLLDTKLPEDLIGNSTESSIHSGVVNGILREIDGTINEYKGKFSDLTVILTGGDSDFLSKQLKNTIFANSNFLLEGLNFILEFNSN